MVEGCKFSFWRKFSEREGGRGRGLWCGLIAAIKLDMALWGLAQCALCNVQFAMWYVIWLYDALNTLDFHPLHKPRNLTTALWAAPAPLCKNAHDPRPRFPHPHHPLDTQGGLDLQCPRRENICDGHPSCWHWKFTQLPARVGSNPYPDRSVAANEPGADSKDTKAALSRPPSHALSSVSKYIILNTMTANVQMLM